MITKIQEVKTTIKAKGIVKCVDDFGIHIEDFKTGEISVLSLDEFKIFLDKEINFSVTESKKDEEEVNG